MKYAISVGKPGESITTVVTCASTSSTRIPSTICAHRVAHHRGLRVAHDHVALARVVRRRRLAGLGQPGLDDQVPEAALQLLDAVHGPHLAPALPAQVDAAGRELPLRRVEPVEEHQLAPHPVEVDVVHVAQHRRELGARRPGPDLGHRDRAVRAPEPLHVRQPVAHARAPATAAGPTSRIAA